MKTTTILIAVLFAAALCRAEGALDYRNIGPEQTLGRILTTLNTGSSGDRRAATEELGILVAEQMEALGTEPSAAQHLSLAGDGLGQLLWSGSAVIRVRSERLLEDIIDPLGHIASEKAESPRREAARKLLERYAGVFAVEPNNVSCKKLGEQLADIFKNAKMQMTVVPVGDLASFGTATSAATTAPAAENVPVAAPPAPEPVLAQNKDVAPKVDAPEVQALPAAAPAPAPVATTAPAPAATIVPAPKAPAPKAETVEIPAATAVPSAPRPTPAPKSEVVTVQAPYAPKSPVVSAAAVAVKQAARPAPAPAATLPMAPPVTVTVITLPSRPKPVAPPAQASTPAPAPAASVSFGTAPAALRLLADQLQSAEERTQLSALHLADRLADSIRPNLEDASVSEASAVSANIVARIREFLRSGKPDVKLMAAQVAGKLMDRLAVNQLINLLGQGDEGLRAAAADSLERITGQKFGQDAAKWAAWTAENQG